MKPAAERVARLRTVRRLDDAEREARTALQAEPQDPDLLLELAVVLMERERHDEGLAAADAAGAVAPQTERVHRVRGHLLSRLGRHDEALAAMYRSVQLAPHEATVARSYAIVLNRAGRRVDAQQVALRAVELEPHDPATHLTLADVASDRGDVATARRAYTEALRLDPENAAARHDLAVLDMRARRSGAAVRGLLEAGRMDPTIAEVRLNLAAELWRLSYRLRLVLIGAVILLPVLAAATDAEVGNAVRLGAVAVLAVVALLGWRTGRGLPPRAGRALVAAGRSDRPLMVTIGLMAVGVLAVLGAAVTGAVAFVGVVVVVVLAASALGVLTSLIRAARRPRRR